jgi:hypothetical protein
MKAGEKDKRQLAEEHLQTVEKIYSEIGTPGYFALNYVIRPLRDRFLAGECTEKLYDEIFEVKA